MWERRALKLSISIAAALPVVSGLWGIVHGASDGTWTDAWTDNHHRYLSGLLLAIGLGYWSTVPGIEAMGGRLRFLTALVVTGGLARLLGVTLGDAATPSVIAALAMELLVAPLLCLWQARIVSRPRRDLPGDCPIGAPFRTHRAVTLWASRSATGSFAPWPSRTSPRLSSLPPSCSASPPVATPGASAP